MRFVKGSALVRDSERQMTSGLKKSLKFRGIRRSFFGRTEC